MTNVETQDQEPRQTDMVVAGSEETTRSSILDTERGRTTIADIVVAKVAGMAARETNGIHELVSGGGLSGIAGAFSSNRNTLSRGVQAKVDRTETTVDVRVVTVYGENIPSVTDKLRQNIIERVEQTTGLEVREVNIHVADIHFPPEATEPSSLEQPALPDESESSTSAETTDESTTTR